MVVARSQQEWEAGASNLLKAAIKRKGMTYADVVARLAEEGVAVNETSLRNKLSRGTFSAAFLLQCLKAIGVETLRMD
jgi:lambda repressor-like predicted transcriptional regulator